MGESIEIQPYFTYFLIWLISTLMVRHFLKKKQKKSTIIQNLINLPPSPPSIPILGHIHHLSPTIYKSFHTLSSKYGPLLYLRLASAPLLLVSSASTAREIFKTHDVNFASRPQASLPDTFIFGDAGFAFAPYGDYWRFMKKLCVTKMLGARQLERSRGIRREELTNFLAIMFDKAKKNEVVDVGHELMKLSNNTTCRMAMSTRSSGQDNEADKVRWLMKETNNLMTKSGFAMLLGPLGKLGMLLCEKQKLDLVRRFDELLEGILGEHEDEAWTGNLCEDDKDMIDILLESYHDKDAEVKISRFNMKAFILDLFFAGTSSTSDAMQIALSVLINHPNVLHKVREEIESAVGGNRLVEERDIARLPYLQSVVKETLRLFPPSTVTSRVNTEDCRIGGFDVPKGTTTYVNIYSVLRDPTLWDDPEEFRPERFLSLPGEFGYVPFGGGRRMCPGMNLALCMVQGTIAGLVQCFDWEVSNGGGGGKVDMRVKAGFTTTMAEPLMCVPAVRCYPFAGYLSRRPNA